MSLETQVAGGLGSPNEYRSNDWYYIPVMEDMRAGSDVSGKSTSWK